VAAGLATANYDDCGDGNCVVLKGKKEGEINKRVDGRRTLNLM
jgi:hypothetical protein